MNKCFLLLIILSVLFLSISTSFAQDSDSKENTNPVKNIYTHVKKKVRNYFSVNVDGVIHIYNGKIKMPDGKIYRLRNYFLYTPDGKVYAIRGDLDSIIEELR